MAASQYDGSFSVIMSTVRKELKDLDEKLSSAGIRRKPSKGRSESETDLDLSATSECSSRDAQLSATTTKNPMTQASYHSKELAEDVWSESRRTFDQHLRDWRHQWEQEWSQKTVAMDARIDSNEQKLVAMMTSIRTVMSSAVDENEQKQHAERIYESLCENQALASLETHQRELDTRLHHMESQVEMLNAQRLEIQASSQEMLELNAQAVLRLNEMQSMFDSQQNWSRKLEDETLEGDVEAWSRMERLFEEQEKRFSELHELVQVVARSQKELWSQCVSKGSIRDTSLSPVLEEHGAQYDTARAEDAEKDQEELDGIVTASLLASVRTCLNRVKAIEAVTSDIDQRLKQVESQSMSKDSGTECSTVAQGSQQYSQKLETLAVQTSAQVISLAKWVAELQSQITDEDASNQVEKSTLILGPNLGGHHCIETTGMKSEENANSSSASSPSFGRPRCASNLSIDGPIYACELGS